MDARDLVTGREQRFGARTFVDASGRAALARLTGATLMSGREAAGEYDEPLAPPVADTMHHGNTPLFHVGLADEPVEFGPLPWAEEVAQGYACLASQMGQLSQDNQPGPCAGEPSTPEEAAELGKQAQAKLVAGVQQHGMMPPEEVIHLFPGTHFWEYGQFLDMEEPGNEELVRDHLLRALYGTMANVKAAMPEKYANLHFPGDEEHDFRLAKWIYDLRDPARGGRTASRRAAGDDRARAGWLGAADPPPVR